ncbi:MAG: hypothetical protein ABJN62_14590 [Halioglobus sp.]
MGVETVRTKCHPGWIFAALFFLALLPRLYSAQTLGWDWDHPGSFTLINFDEGGSCRAAMVGFSYSTFIGQQTIAIASAIGHAPAPGISGDPRAVKSYCHSPGHILVARSYSALLGSLTVLILVCIGLQLSPGAPAVAWTAGGLLAVSGFHISQSQSGTVDAASTFFIYLFIAVLIWGCRRGPRTGLLASPLFALFAVWTKYWVFALFAYAATLPVNAWKELSAGYSRRRLVLLVLTVSVGLAAMTNPVFPKLGLVAIVAAYLIIVPWRQASMPMKILWAILPLMLWGVIQVDLIFAYTTSGAGGRFGSGYAAIGENKWLRNLVNVPAVTALGIGIPACLFLPKGVRYLLDHPAYTRLWVCLLPVLAFLLFMAFLAPVTYYRHYLPLIPAACLLAALGLHSTSWGRRPWFLLLFLAWPALLAWDMVVDYHQDPRKIMRPWYQQHSESAMFTSFYVSPPAGLRAALFRPEYAAGEAEQLKQADFLVLSENWYDTAFANELNGPLVSDLEKLVKTKPEYAAFYRRALSGKHPLLEPAQAFDLMHFMPELLLHKQWYGNFQLFVGDVKVFRVRK